MSTPPSSSRWMGVQYVGEYAPELCDGYRPGEFGSGESVSVRFEGGKMFVRRPDGRELETTIVRKMVMSSS